MSDRRWPRVVAVLAAVLAVAGAGWAAGRATAPDTPPRPVGLYPQPTRIVHGVPVGWPHTRAGAIAAVAAYAEALNDPGVVFDPARRQAIVGTLATKRYARTFEGAAARALNQVKKSTAIGRALAGPGRRTLLVVPLTYQALSYAPTRAVIRNWAVGVVGNDRSYAPRATWSTTTMVVVWRDDDWKVDAVPNPTDGPTPSSDSPSAPRGLFDALSEMQEFHYVP